MASAPLPRYCEPVIQLLIAAVLLVTVVFFLWKVFQAFRAPRILCETCNANSPRYCSLPDRGSATFCEDYSPKGGYR